MTDLERTVWGTRWCWHDVIVTLMEKKEGGALVEKFFALPEDAREEVMDACQHSLSKGMESGIMQDWTVIMDVSIDCSGLVAEIEDAYFNYEQAIHGRSETNLIREEDDNEYPY